MRILHLLHRSVPGTHGYAIRSREIVVHQLAKGLEPMVVTSPSQAPLGKLDPEGSEFIDGIRYFRTCGKLFPGTAEVYDPNPLRSYIRVLQNVQLLRTALRVARKYRPDIIHGHSPFTCGLIGNLVGRLTGIPSVYEVRGIWEESHTSRHGLQQNSFRYRAAHDLESIALRGARMDLVLCEGLKTEIMSRGIHENKIVVTPNAVDVKTFFPAPFSEGLHQALGLQNRIVMGYLGSFFHYEGLDLLVRAMIKLAPRYPNLLLMLVGTGEVLAELRSLVEQAGISDRVIFTGIVPHAEIVEYYRVCDFMVLPRKDTIETRMVTPLKPLEILAMAKPVIASDIGGHREILQDGVNGLLFQAENVDDLVAKCVSLIENEDYRKDLGNRARKWVAANRDWDVMVMTYLHVYEQLAGKRG
jgi:PEP-CTERM/exosortase A-associated glycosyltransferase